MNWLLISILKGNPGDLLIRRGVERLIRKVDPDAVFDVLAKNDPSTWTPRPFDRAVICGMPLFWDEDFTSSDTMEWWPLITGGWPSADPRRFIALGVGSCCSSPAPALAARSHLDAVAKHAWRVVTRDDFIHSPHAEHICCPAIFAVKDTGGTEKLVNLMPSGGHWESFNPRESRCWRDMRPHLANIFAASGWKYVAHSKANLDHALREGWSGESVLADTTEKLASVYGECGRYFGNRVHGGIAAAGAHASVWCVGYDSRRFAVESVGGVSCLPSDLRQINAEDYAYVRWSPRHPSIGFNREAALNRYVQVLKEFAQ